MFNLYIVLPQSCTRRIELIDEYQTVEKAVSDLIATAWETTDPYMCFVTNDESKILATITPTVRYSDHDGEIVIVNDAGLVETVRSTYLLDEEERYMGTRVQWKDGRVEVLDARLLTAA